VGARVSGRATSRTTNVAVVGCGDILDAYMLGLQRVGRDVHVVRCADLLVDRAEEAATRHGIPRWGDVEAVFRDDEVEVVVSLTPPLVHHEIIGAAAAAGKHVFTEKPLSASTALAAEARATADRHGVVVGCAPDTFLGSAGQTARAAIDAGMIGEPIACTAFSPYSRAERRHPNPAFLFSPGAGPLMDMAPYFVVALVNLLGPIASVSGLTTTGASERRIPRPDGTTLTIDVTTPTHVTSLFRFRGGHVATFVSSFEIWDHHLPEIEIYGTEGTLSVPHANWYDGDVRLKLHDEEWRTLPPATPTIQTAPREKVRGVGVVDLIGSLRGEPHRTSGALGFHTLEVLEAIQRSNDEGRWVRIESQPRRPAPMSGVASAL
jgi:predicted dehydrogenase